MANLIVSSNYNMTEAADFFGPNSQRTSATATGFVVEDPGYGSVVTVTGNGIQYDANGRPISGNITSIVATSFGQPLFNLTDANVDIATMQQIAAIEAQTGATDISLELQYWLRGNDNITVVPGVLPGNIHGYAGNDLFIAESGSNQIFGDEGFNGISYSHASNQFTISNAGNGVWQVFEGDPLAPISENTLHNVQQVQFADQTLQTTWFDHAASLYATNPSEFSALTEMYIAYFNRAPDATGLFYWANDIYNGQTRLDIANSFFQSPEAMATYGNISSQSSVQDISAFVSNVYENVLNRGPDQAGLDYWVHDIQSGIYDPSQFILAILNAVDEQVGTRDKIYLSNKTAVGEHFAVQDGLTDVAEAAAVMNLYNSTYDTSGVNAAVNAANNLSDIYLDTLGQHSELVIHLVGVA